MKGSRSVLVGLSLALASVACTPTANPGAEVEKDETLAAFELERLPKEDVTTTLVDFGGKVHLIGYQVTPTDAVHPGATVRLKLYWRAVAPLGPGFRLATYVIAGRRVDAFESGSALRQAKGGPSAWRRDTIYSEEQQIEIPADIEAKEITLAVGITRDALPKPEPKAAASAEPPPAEPAEEITHPPLRLPVLSGASDGEERAVLAHLRNDVTKKPAPRARRAPGDANRRPPRAASSAR